MKHTETTETEKEFATTSSSTQPTRSPKHRGFRKFGIAIAAVLSLIGLSAAVVGIVTSSASAESDQNEQKSFNLNELAQENDVVSDCGANAFSKVLGIDTSDPNSNAFLILSKGDGVSMSITDGDTTTVVSPEQRKEIKQEIQDCLDENPEALEELRQQRFVKFCTRDELPEAVSEKCAEGHTPRGNEQKSFNLNELAQENDVVSTCGANAFSKVLGIDTSDPNSNAFLILSKGDGVSMSITDGDTTTVVSPEQRKEIKQEIQDCLDENSEALEELRQQRVAKFCTRDELPEAVSEKCAEGHTPRGNVGARGEIVKGIEPGEGI